MADKQGCKVELILNCYDENGELISNTDNTWFGMERKFANAMCKGIIGALLGLIDTWEEAAEQQRRGKQAR